MDQPFPQGALPDLYSVSKVLLWEQACLKEGWSRKQIFEAYQHTDTCIGLYRAYFYLDLPENARGLWQQTAYQRICAETQFSHFRWMAEGHLLAAASFAAFLNGDDFLLHHACDHLPVLLDRLRQHPQNHEFYRECEYRLLRLMVWKNILLERNEEGLKLSRELLALSLQLPQDLQHGARHLYLSILHNMHRYHDVLSEMVHTNPLMASRHRFLVVDNALCFSNLGDFQAALKELEAHAPLLDVHLKDFYWHYFHLLHMHGALDVDFNQYRGKVQSHFNLIHGMQLLFQARSLPEGKLHQHERETLLRKCLQVLDEDKEVLLRYELHMEQWIRSAAHLMLHNHHLCRYHLSQIRHDEAQDDYFQVLHHGLILELCTVPALEHPFSAEHSMQCILQVLHNSAERSRSNFLGVEGLLDRLFPVVSCAASLLAPHLHFSSNKKEMLLDFRRKNLCRGVKLPLNYALEVLLREVAPAAKHVFTAPLNGEMTRQRDQYHEITPHAPISIFKLGYLMHQMEKPHLQDLMADLYFTLGLPEQVRSSYERELLAEVVPLVKDFVLGKLSKNTFDGLLKQYTDPL